MALAVVKDRFESGAVFMDDDMGLMEQVTITWVTTSICLYYIC